MERTPEEIENERVEKLKERDSLKESMRVVHLEKLDLEKQVAELHKKMVEGRYALSRLNTEIEILTSQFWALRNR